MLRPNRFRHGFLATSTHQWLQNSKKHLGRLSFVALDTLMSLLFRMSFILLGSGLGYLRVCSLHWQSTFGSDRERSNFFFQGQISYDFIDRIVTQHLFKNWDAFGSDKRQRRTNQRQQHIILITGHLWSSTGRNSPIAQFQALLRPLAIGHSEITQAGSPRLRIWPWPDAMSQCCNWGTVTSVSLALKPPFVLLWRNILISFCLRNGGKPMRCTKLNQIPASPWKISDQTFAPGFPPARSQPLRSIRCCSNPAASPHAAAPRPPPLGQSCQAQLLLPGKRMSKRHWPENCRNWAFAKATKIH